jgi:hypothetical protein
MNKTTNTHTPNYKSYGIGAVADTTDFITWRHLYGFEAVLMLITGVIYCFMSPDLVQVLPRVRPLNVLKMFGGT